MDLVMACTCVTLQASPTRMIAAHRDRGAVREMRKGPVGNRNEKRMAFVGEKGFKKQGRER
ncbi:hypothetical protein C4D60_Mb10t09770 [Musa balbisiana]|uniref:Uncharacterized protein n=1 Tax=Musa balbisiana TaxID=52838 RepID=A0A4S8IXA4_MUSBA|nr:hypothetical protein C4D60_Mb10t09770 [Musa balbisiana]